MKIFVNAGHKVGVDSGAINKNFAIEEASICLSIAEKLVPILESMNFDVQMEQSDNLCGEEGYDYFDSVCYHSNDWRADIFISIHCNAFNTYASGTEVFYGSDAGFNLAQNVQDRLVDVLHTKDRGVKKCLELMVIKNTDAVAILIETAFIDNNYDAEKLIDESYQYGIAEAIANGVLEYAQTC